MQTIDPYRRFFLACVLFLALLIAGCAGKAVAPGETLTTPPADTQNVYIVVREDGITLNGRLFGAQNEVLVILSHMRPNDQTAWFDFAQELADKRYAALTFNFRGYGDSEGDQDFDKLDEDLSTVVRYMRDDLGRHQTFLVGASMGGTASLVVAAQQDVAGVVAVSAPAQFEEQDALSAVPSVTAPKLLIASEDDTAAMVSLDELLEASGDPTESETYTGNAHGTDLLQSEHAAAVRARILQFLGEHARP
jgi:pimeloyl-ACP methyl ester carboxylesterase